MRGWGDLAAGTPVHWLGPWEDLLARGHARDAIYHTGGCATANPGTAARGTYGW